MESQDIDFIQVIRQSGLILLFLALFNRFVSMTFVLNFTTGGVNSTLLFTLIPISAILFLLISWKDSINDFLVNIIWGGFLILSVLSLLDVAGYASLASALALNISGIIFLTSFDLKTTETRISLVFAPVVQYTIYSFLGQIYLFSSDIGTAIYLLILLGVVMSLLFSKVSYSPSEVSFLEIYPYLAMLLLFLGVPSIIATWTYDGLIVSFLPLSLYIIILQLVMTIAFIISVYYPNPANKMSAPVYTLVMILSLLDVLLLKLLPPLTVAIVIYCSASRFSAFEETQEVKNFKLLVLIQQFLVLIFLFLYVSAGNWAFLPSLLGTISRGLAWLYIFLTGGLFLLTDLYLRRI